MRAVIGRIVASGTVAVLILLSHPGAAAAQPPGRMTPSGRPFATHLKFNDPLTEMDLGPRDVTRINILCDFGHPLSAGVEAYTTETDPESGEVNSFINNLATNVQPRGGVTPAGLGTAPQFWTADVINLTNVTQHVIMRGVAVCEGAGAPDP